MRGAVPTPLPLLPCIVLQAAIRFINLTVPSSARPDRDERAIPPAHGASTPEAVAAGAVDDVSEKIVEAVLVVGTLPFVRVNIDTNRFAAGGSDARLAGAIAIAPAVGIAVMLAVPSLRARFAPQVRAALDAVTGVARVRRKRLELFGGNLAGELLMALVLGAACRAYGADVSFAELVFVRTASGVLSGLIPGGIGAAEATTAAGLIAVGVDESTAFAIALTKRLCTFYLPPIWGYPALPWLRRKGYV